MKYLVFGVFIFGLAFTPVYVLDNMIMPELQNMKNFYGGMDQVAQDVAAGKEYPASEKYYHAEKSDSQLRAQLER